MALNCRCSLQELLTPSRFIDAKRQQPSERISNSHRESDISDKFHREVQQTPANTNVETVNTCGTCGNPITLSANADPIETEAGHVHQGRKEVRAPFAIVGEVNEVQKLMLGDCWSG